MRHSPLRGALVCLLLTPVVVVMLESGLRALERASDGSPFPRPAP